MAKIHELKCWPEFYEPFDKGLKSFEYRKNDRGFELGDELLLREWNPNVPRPDGEGYALGRYTGRQSRARVVYVLRGPDAGVPEGFCVMSLIWLPS